MHLKTKSAAGLGANPVSYTHLDIHSHSDTTLPAYPQAESRILQGITTEIGGDCGLSVAPVSPDPEKKKQLRDYVGDLDYTWNTCLLYTSPLGFPGKERFRSTGTKS